MIIIFTLIARSLFHAYFSGSVFFFINYFLRIEIKQKYFILLALVVSSFKELMEYFVGWSYGAEGINDLIRDVVLVTAFTLILLILKTKSSKLTKRTMAFLVLFSFFPLMVGNTFYNLLFISRDAPILYKHLIDIFSLSIGSLLGIRIIGKILKFQ